MGELVQIQKCKLANISTGSIKANSYCKKLRTSDLYLQEVDERELPIRDQVRGETCQQK